jgi:hypothetical protein
MKSGSDRENDKPASRSAGLIQALFDAVFQDDSSGRGKEIKWNFFLGVAVFLGFVTLFLFAFHQPAVLQTTASIFLLAGAALAAGILIGFLFGIPRARQQANAQSDPQSTEGYAVNTNLEQISDWLTKIIVGVGLIQLATFPGKLKALAGYFANAIGPGTISGSLVLAILGFFAIFGFLIGYLWARIYLTGEFSRAERLAKDRPEYYEGLIHAYLYQPKPKGFENAIREAETYVKRFNDNVRVWEYLACAYGQQYSYLKRAPQRNETKLNEVRARALDAIKRAIQIDGATAKEFLKRLWDPEEASAGEDDLRDFYEFPEFKEVFEDEKDSETVTL